MRNKSKEHEKLNEDLQNLLSYIGELIDECDEVTHLELHELHEWLSDIMVDHYEINSN